MKFDWHTEPETKDLVFSGRVSARDLQNVRFDHVERTMMRMPHTSPADMLLLLEMLFRRVSEQESAGPIATLADPS